MSPSSTTVGAVRTTRVGFGTSRLHYLDRSIDRQRILAAAYEFGIRHFDTAPVYGHGLAEREVGRFVRGRRDSIVATKYGIAASPWIGSLPDRLLKPAILARTGLNKVLRGSVALPITPWGLRSEVEASLRRLKRDVIDIHLLHEPDLAKIKDLDGIIATYENLVAEGKIRVAGISGDFGTALSLLKLAPGLVLQTGEGEWTDLHTPDITYGAISRQPQSRSQSPVASEAAKFRLAAALARRPRGVVLLSTTKERNLCALVD